MDKSTETEIRKYLSNANLLLDTIDRQLENVPLEELPLGIMSGNKEGESGYRDMRNGRPVHRVLDAMLNSVSSQLRNACCVRAGYCGFKKTHRDAIDVVKAVLDGLLSAAFVFPIPAATVAVYCVQSFFLDRLCQCDAESGHQ